MVGLGILKGLRETARNLIGSFYQKERLTTVQYPEKKIAPKENNRNFPFLVFDKDPEANLRCVSCKICEKECPPQCIYIVQKRDGKGKAVKYPEVFDIDVSVCMSCQICVEVCPFDAIKMDQEFALSREDRFEDLLFDRVRLSKSNEYYHQIHPTEAGEVDGRLKEQRKQAEAKAEAKKQAAEKAAA
jgi:NADH-quinone oxidoreductase subunit I